MALPALSPRQALILRVARHLSERRIFGAHGAIVQGLVRAIESDSSDFGETVRMIGGIWPPEFAGHGSRWRDAFETDVLALVQGGLVTVSGHKYPEGIIFDRDTADEDIHLTDEGERVAEAANRGRRLLLRPSPRDVCTIFVALALGKRDVDELYERCLAPPCRTLGYDPVRVDLTEPSETITAAILDGVSSAACVIADLSYARQSVYFEVGYANALGLPVLLTCRRDHHRGTSDTRRVHFDLEQFKISFWTRTSRGQYRWGRGASPKDRLASLVRLR